MAKNIRELPFTELVERVNQIARAESTNDESRIRAAIHDEYLRNIPNKEDWRFLIANSAIVCTIPYNDGTVAINTGDTALTGTNTTWTSDMQCRLLKLTDNPNVYTVRSFLATTSLLINPPLSEDINITAGAYNIYQPFYALAPDFGRFQKNIALQKFQGGRPSAIREVQGESEYRDFYNSSPGIPEKVRLLDMGTAGLKHVELIPPPLKAFVFPYDYVRVLPTMRETTAGTATVTASAGTVTFGGGAKVAEMTTGDFFRIDGFGTGEDSEWYRILALDVANSQATLNLTFGLSGAVAANYTVCNAPLIPADMHLVILKGAVMQVMADQTDPTFALAASERTALLIEARKLYKSRVYDQDIETVAEDYHYRR